MGGDYLNRKGCGDGTTVFRICMKGKETRGRVV